jgi:5-methylcytosine-specific restriction endonuclease McrA
VARKSNSRNRSLPPTPMRFPSGKRICEWCGKPLSGRQRKWCSVGCVKDWLSTWQWEEIAKRALRRVVEPDGTVRCQGCREFLLFNIHRVPFDIDHITPLADGGSNDPQNLQILCVPCHKKKTSLEAKARRKK